ncbi:hypothetical protein BC938DRAFT_479518 [Jimgerdemannia flammicorona]|uniref:SH3 domain-containing protein n=1 Tax=Jimgerdemannia flammicorona TaxID=994334 RepID=A0A433QXW9_9FUNG|nr:hypothetical protein BC938DRAFT_479518 [Jimgerdemannia flammicorona]
MPVFFRLRVEFIDPIFQSFFFMQCRIYSLMMVRMQELTQSGYFQSMDRGVVEGFQWRREKDPIQKVMEEMELLRRNARLQEAKGIAGADRTHDRETATPSRPSSTLSRPPTANVPTSSAYNSSRSYATDDALADEESEALPPYTPPSVTVSAARASFQSPKSVPSIVSSYGGGPSVVPRPPPPAPRGPKPTFVLALYDYEAQAEGDLSFKKDDKIEVVEKTQDVNDWWTGKLKGKVGVFPGNYVAEL